MCWCMRYLVARVTALHILKIAIPSLPLAGRFNTYTSTLWFALGAEFQCLWSTTFIIIVLGKTIFWSLLIYRKKLLVKVRWNIAHLIPVAHTSIWSLFTHRGCASNNQISITPYAMRLCGKRRPVCPCTNLTIPKDRQRRGFHDL